MTTPAEARRILSLVGVRKIGTDGPIDHLQRLLDLRQDHRDPSLMTRAELQVALRELGVPHSANKPVLQSRLRRALTAPLSLQKPPAPWTVKLVCPFSGAPLSDQLITERRSAADEEKRALQVRFADALALASRLGIQAPSELEVRVERSGAKTDLVGAAALWTWLDVAWTLQVLPASRNAAERLDRRRLESDLRLHSLGLRWRVNPPSAARRAWAGRTDVQVARRALELAQLNGRRADRVISVAIGALRLLHVPGLLGVTGRAIVGDITREIPCLQVGRVKLFTPRHESLGVEGFRQGGTLIETANSHGVLALLEKLELEGLDRLARLASDAH